MVNRISDLLTQPQMGIGAALTAIIGQNMGAGLYDRAHAIFRRALLWVLMISTVGCIIVFFSSLRFLESSLKIEAMPFFGQMPLGI